MEGSIERYQKLGLRESLSRTYQYPIACKELSFILRGAYSKLPKNLQSLIFQDTLTAFRLLPDMQTQTAISAAILLHQSVEAALPKQKRVMAVTEFKHAVVSHKRRGKARQEEEGSAQLPQDVLVLIFSFLDLRSLASAAVVCRSWNTASSDNYLWQLQYNHFFSDSDNTLKLKVPTSGRMLQNTEFKHLEVDDIDGVHIGWRDAFKSAYKGMSSKKFTYRGYCRRCDAIVWLTNIRYSNRHCRPNCENRQIKPLSNQQIVDYIMDDLLTVSSSDSDSDSDEVSTSKLWAYPRRIRKQ